MMEAEIYAIRKALKLLPHDEDFILRRAMAAEEAVDAIEKLLRDLVGFDPAKKYGWPEKNTAATPRRS